MARISVVQYEQAEGELKSIYDDLMEERGKLSEVLKIQSLHPETIKSHTQLYLDIMLTQSPLTRAERELIATVVSVINGCNYCQIHHSTALNAYWKDQERINKLLKDYKLASLSSKEMVMCDFAVHLTKNPSEHEKNNYTETLKEVGLDDRSILDLVLVISYFNFVNRTVLALGVQLEQDKGEGYIY
ncbi:peroxidase-related enzyme [Flavisolibacter nicotianae]|uniref:peroxidase-related enzyme n=1 Tax=Flavisolibacter nicotianae TaxID=2364882 RepID=UPI000EAFC938|nr:peroxidase-related enzyme [Flavisolibacter nicotianae]